MQEHLSFLIVGYLAPEFVRPPGEANRHQSAQFSLGQHFQGRSIQDKKE